MRVGPSKCGAIILKGDASKFTPRPADPDTQRRHQEIREKLRQYAPEEYAAMMKQREEYLKKRQLQQKPPEDTDKK